MTAAADRILTDAEVHTLGPDGVVEAIALRDGRVVKLGSAGAVGLLAGVGTDVIDCGGRPVLPGFVDAHTHLHTTGRYLVHADLSGAADRAAVLERLGSDRAEHGDWRVGIGYDESAWDGGRALTREHLDAVSADRPVAAFRVDMHTAAINSVALERLGDRLPEAYVEREGGTPTGVILEDALDVVRGDIGGGELTGDLLRAAQAHALSRGVTSVNDFVRGSSVPRAYHALERSGELRVRVRLSYWRDHLDAVTELGLATGHGSDRLTVGAIKSFSDGSIGGRTAKLFEPYADGEGTGTWVVEPATLRALVDRVDTAGLQVAIHAIGDAAIEEALTAIERADDPGGARHRIEHVELATDDHIERLADAGIVASVQPNFHRWAHAGGLYETRLGERARRTNRLRDLADAGVPLAFGSDSMPLDPLYGIHHAVNAPHAHQRLTVDEAIEAYTRGSAYAAFCEDERGHLGVGAMADCVVLERSPWEHPDAIDEIAVWRTLVDGQVEHEREAG